MLETGPAVTVPVASARRFVANLVDDAELDEVPISRRSDQVPWADRGGPRCRMLI